MIGTLTTPAAAPISLRFLNNSCLSHPISTRSSPKLHFNGGTACRASLNAVIDADPAVESTARRPATLYEVLRVNRNATATEIKTAYRSLAKLYHPDASDYRQHDDRDFIQIHDAYATLSDPASRAMYDRKFSVGIGRRSGLYKASGKRTGFYSGRRWETDQCW